MTNLLFITVDQWRGDCLSAVGHPCVKTPNLDRLANDGALFLRHYGQATPCGPSRASLYTGLYMFNHRSVSNGTPLDARHRTVAEIARRAGWDPVLFGHTDVSADPRGLAPGDPRLRTYEGIAPGFRAELLMGEDLAPWLEHLRRRGHGELALEDLYERPFGTPAPFRAEDSETAFLTDRFLEWLDDRKRGGWFAHLSYIKPHPPYIAAAPWHAAVSPSEVPPPVRAPTLAEEAAVHPWLRLHLELGYGGWTARHLGQPRDLDAATVARMRAAYYGLIAELDHHLGRIFARLTARGEMDRTLVVFASDHGDMLGDHWMLDKRGFFPQAFHVPLIIRDPSPEAVRGVRIGAFTEHVDLMPTMLEWLGLAVPLQCDGRSLVPLLRGRRPTGWRDAAVYEHDFRDLRNGRFERYLELSPEACCLMVRLSRRRAYVHFAALPALCYDLERDPDWRTDIASDPGRRAEVLAEAQALLSFRMLGNERRLTGALLTSAGVLGRFDPD